MLFRLTFFLMLTKQEIFDYVAGQLRDQRKRQRAGYRQIVAQLEYNPDTDDLRVLNVDVPNSSAWAVGTPGYYKVGGVSFDYKRGSLEAQAQEDTAYIWDQVSAGR